MRFIEFKKSNLSLIVEQIVSELRTNPNSLQKFMQTGAATQLTAGFEAELVFPVSSGEPTYSDGEPELDWDQDERLRNSTIHDAAQWFKGEFNTQRSVDRFEAKLLERFEEWVGEQFDEHWNDNEEDLVREFITNNEAGSDDEIDKMIASALADEDNNYESARDDARTDFYNEEAWGNMSDFWDSQGFEWMRDIFENYMEDIEWPHYIYPEDVVDFTTVVEELVYDFQEKLNAVVEISDTYHGKTKDDRSWYFEPDSSIDSDDGEGTGVEIVSPPMPIQEMLSKMEECFAWAKANGATSNKSTGLHIGMSLPTEDAPDYIKLVLFLGDTHVLEQFGREANSYTKAALNQIKKKFDYPLSPAAIDGLRVEAMDRMRRGMITSASKLIFTKNSEKYISVNQHSGYVEFRSMGGDYLNMLPVIKNTVMRFAQAYVVASDPTAHKQEYAKKLAKLINPGGNDELSPFVDFALGVKRKEELDTMYKANGAEDQIIPMSTAKQNLAKDMKSKLLIRHPKSAASTTPLGTVPKKPPLFKPALLPGTDIEAKKKMPPAAITPVEDKLAGLPWSRWTVVDAAGRHYYVSARDGVEAHTRMLADHPEFSSRDITNIVHQ